MKKIFIAACAAALAFTGCKEHDTPLTFVQAKDSTYVLSAASIPAADPHNVLVEEFTGQSCSNCPAAHTALEGLAASGNVIVVGLYILNPNFIQTFVPNGAKYDFRTLDAKQIGDNVYGSVGSLPTGGVDRVPVGGNILLGSNDWSSAIGTRKSVSDSVNLSVQSIYNSGDSSAAITATVTYLKGMSSKLDLSVLVVEDSMVDIQETQTGTGTDTAYVFTNVYRGMASSVPLGDHILDTMAVKEAGRVYLRRYKFSVAGRKPGIRPKHCRVIAFVNRDGTGGNYEIMQAAETRLEP